MKRRRQEELLSLTGYNIIQTQHYFLNHNGGQSITVNILRPSCHIQPMLWSLNRMHLSSQQTNADLSSSLLLIAFGTKCVSSEKTGNLSRWTDSFIFMCDEEFPQAMVGNLWIWYIRKHTDGLRLKSTIIPQPLHIWRKISGFPTI